MGDRWDSVIARGRGQRRSFATLAALLLAPGFAFGAPQVPANGAPPSIRVAYVSPAISQPSSRDPAVIFYDDFEGPAALQARYFEYDGANGSFVRSDGEGYAGRGAAMECVFRKGQVGAGSLKVLFGRNPFGRGIRPQETFREVYWRVYVKHEPGWEGNPAKLARMTCLAAGDWSQGFIAHVWGGRDDALCIDPATGITDGHKVTAGYNDFPHLRWLGAVQGHTPLFSAAESGRWVCVESHVRLNTPGRRDGVFELWVDGQREAAHYDLDWHGAWSEYAINAVFLENYWNAGSVRRQARWFDDFVVSTHPIGPITATAVPIVTRTPGVGVSAWEAQVASDPDGADVVWASRSLGGAATSVAVGPTHGRFGGSRAGGRVLGAGVTHWLRVRERRGSGAWSAWTPWHAPFRTPVGGKAPMAEQVRFYVDPSTNSDDPERRRAYGLSIVPPWPDGGSLFANLPEHLEYMPGTRGIARHHDNRRNVWQVSEDGSGARYEVESLTEPGVFLSMQARADGPRAHLEMTIANRSKGTLRSIRPLLCFQYHSLTGFPASSASNFAHTFVVVGGKLVEVDHLTVKRPGAYARMAQVAGCPDEHNWWAEEMGGLSRERLDMAFTALTASRGDRKVVVFWTPGKNLLTNSAIPCIHADPYFGDLAPGESRSARGEVVFTQGSLEPLVREMAARAERPWAQPAAHEAGQLPRGPGLAARYPGDKGIAGDRSVLFADDFEVGSVDQVTKHWRGETSNKGGRILSLSPEVPSGSPGKQSLQMTGTLGADSGGHLYTVFPGADTAFVRFYVKFAPDAAYEHHFVELGGYNPPTTYPNPRAGTKPQGDDRVMVFIDPVGSYGRYPPPGVWSLYTYWPEMKISADNNYWGNCLSPAEPQRVPRDRWQCVELMVKMNTPDRADGELALWLDGELVEHVRKGVPRGPWSGMGFDLLRQGGEPFEGLRLRTSDALKVNHLWLEHYIDEGAQKQNRLDNPNRVNRVWFDHVVVATQYIGPLQP